MFVLNILNISLSISLQLRWPNFSSQSYILKSDAVFWITFLQVCTPVPIFIRLIKFETKNLYIYIFFFDIKYFLKLFWNKRKLSISIYYLWFFYLISQEVLFMYRQHTSIIWIKWCFFIKYEFIFRLLIFFLNLLISQITFYGKKR